MAPGARCSNCGKPACAWSVRVRERVRIAEKVAQGARKAPTTTCPRPLLLYQPGLQAGELQPLCIQCNDWRLHECVLSSTLVSLFLTSAAVAKAGRTPRRRYIILRARPARSSFPALPGTSNLRARNIESGSACPALCVPLCAYPFVQPRLCVSAYRPSRAGCQVANQPSQKQLLNHVAPITAQRTLCTLPAAQGSRALAQAIHASGLERLSFSGARRGTRTPTPCGVRT